MSKLLAFDESCVARITDARRIIDFRNQLIHGYGVINDQITWNIIEAKLPVLLEELEQLLKDA